MPNLDQQTLLLAFIGVTAAAVLLQSFVLLALWLTVRKATRSFNEQIEDLRSSITPIVDQTRELVTFVKPRIEELVEQFGTLAQNLQAQTADVQQSAQDILNRLQRQVIRIDAMCTSVLDTVDRAGSFVADTVSKPVRQLSGILSSVRAVVESLRNGNQSERPVSNDKDGFI